MKYAQNVRADTQLTQVLKWTSQLQEIMVFTHTLDVELEDLSQIGRHACLEGVESHITAQVRHDDGPHRHRGDQLQPWYLVLLQKATEKIMTYRG